MHRMDLICKCELIIIYNPLNVIGLMNTKSIKNNQDSSNMEQDNQSLKAKTHAKFNEQAIFDHQNCNKKLTLINKTNSLGDHSSPNE